MDIQATKIELMQRLLDTKKERVLERLKKVFEQEQVGFRDELSFEYKAGIFHLKTRKRLGHKPEYRIK